MQYLWCVKLGERTHEYRLALPETRLCLAVSNHTVLKYRPYPSVEVLHGIIIYLDVLNEMIQHPVHNFTDLGHTSTTTVHPPQNHDCTCTSTDSARPFSTQFMHLDLVYGGTNCIYGFHLFLLFLRPAV